MRFKSIPCRVNLAACAGLFFLLILGIFNLPILFPAHIGTGYIFISLAMTTLSVFIWYRDLIRPRSALMLSVFACLILGALLPYTSNDSERYLWDGAVFLSGLDPYLIAPNDPAVAELRKIWPTPEEHAAYPTLYPPGGLSLFAICALAGPTYGIWVWKIMTSAAAILTLVLTYKLLQRRNLTRHFHLIAFSPLLLLEAQVGAHLDIFSALGIVAGLWCIEKDKILWAGIIIGAAATTKFLPAIIIGPYLFYLNPRQAAKLFLGSAGTWLSVYLITFGFGYKPLGLLPTFFEKWRGGAPLYPVLENLQAVFGASNRALLIAISGIAVLGFSVSAILARKKHIEMALILSLSIPLLLSPVLFPWYLLALMPLLALRPTITLFVAISLTPLSYIVLNRWLSEGVWEQSDGASHILLAGIILGIILDIAITVIRKSKPLTNEASC